MSEMFCSYAGRRDEILVSYLYEEIDAAARSEFETHLGVCAECRHELEALRAVRGQLAGWAPPSGVASIADDLRPLISGPRDGQAERDGHWWSEVPMWARAAAAVLVVGMSAGAANLNVRHDQAGWSIRTGWMAEPAAAPQPAAPWRDDLAALEARVRADRAASPAVVQAVDRVERSGDADAELLRKVRALIAQSEKKQENELALQVAGLSRDVQAQRIVDLTKIDNYLRGVSQTTGLQLAQQREAINMALKVSQTR